MASPNRVAGDGAHDKGVFIGCHVPGKGQPKLDSIFLNWSLENHSESDRIDHNHCNETKMGKPSSQKVAILRHKPKWDIWSYRIGCPVWGCRDWGEIIYPNGTPSEDYLQWYSRLFSTVEGNSKFYAVPPKRTFENGVTRPQIRFSTAGLLKCDTKIGLITEQASQSRKPKSPFRITLACAECGCRFDDRAIIRERVESLYR